MEISFYEVTSKNQTFGTETNERFLKKVETGWVPQIGELVGFDDSLESYRVVDVSTWYEESDCSVDVLLVNSENVQ